MDKKNYSAPEVLSVTDLQAFRPLCASFPSNTETITTGSVYDNDDFIND